MKQEKKAGLIFAHLTIFMKHFHLNLLVNIYQKLVRVIIIIIIVIIIINEPGFISFIISSRNKFFIR